MNSNEITIRRFRNEDLAAYKKAYDEIIELKFNEKSEFFMEKDSNFQSYKKTYTF